MVWRPRLITMPGILCALFLMASFSWNFSWPNMYKPNDKAVLEHEIPPQTSWRHKWSSVAHLVSLFSLQMSLYRLSLLALLRNNWLIESFDSSKSWVLKGSEYGKIWKSVPSLHRLLPFASPRASFPRKLIPPQYCEIWYWWFGLIAELIFLDWSIWIR